MSSLTGSSISGTYDQLLALPGGGGGGASGGLKALTDGNGATTFALQLASDKISINQGDKFFFDGGGDTYIWGTSSANQIQLRCGGAGLFHAEYVDGTGNDFVGIPTNTKFKIGADADSVGDTYFIENPDDDLQLYIQSSSEPIMTWDQNATGEGVGTVSIGVDGNGGDFKLFGETSGEYCMWDQSRDDFVLTSNCNIGLGDTTPSYPLVIQTTGRTAIGKFISTDMSAQVFIEGGNVDDESQLLLTCRDESTSGSRAIIRYKHNATPASQLFQIHVGDAAAVNAMTILGDGNMGVGTAAPTHKLHVNGSARVSGHFMRTRNNVEIASGVANVTAGGFVNLQAESGTTDNLDFIQVNGATPDIGTELYLVADSGDTITLRMGTHSGVTDGATALSCIMADEDDTAAAARDTIVLASGWTILHVVYNGRWVVMNPLVAQVTNE